MAESASKLCFRNLTGDVTHALPILYTVIVFASYITELCDYHGLPRVALLCVCETVCFSESGEDTEDPAHLNSEWTVKNGQVWSPSHVEMLCYIQSVCFLEYVGQVDTVPPIPV